MQKNSKARFVNGILALVGVLFFAVHGVLGALSGFIAIPNTFSWLVWAGVALIAAHVVASIVTSRQQLTDVEHPPSARKKRHLMLKWATGIALAAVVVVHIVHMRTAGDSLTEVLASPEGLVSMLVLIALLAVHICVGIKSLLKDIGGNRNHRNALRVIVCVAAAILALACIYLFLS